jgi:diaminopimelate epimerase
VRFHKYHGLGNDFVVVDLRAGDGFSPSPQDPAVVRALCDRQFGIGGDGVLAVLPPRSAGADATMRVLNADGSEAEMCGNGLRCVVKHLYETDPALRKDALAIDTGAGTLRCAVTARDGVAEAVTVDMGAPRLTRGEIPMTPLGGPASSERAIAVPLEVAGRRFEITAVSMGNPHAVMFVDERGPALRALAEAIGPTIEHHPTFPRRTNVELAHRHGPDLIELVVWERGCGITLACGTGACATAVAASLTGRAEPGRELRVRRLGGELAITVIPGVAPGAGATAGPADYATVLMRGPATFAFSGDVDTARALASARPRD